MQFKRLSASKLAIEGNYGEQLKNELSMLAVNETHGPGIDASIFVEQILHTKPGQPDYLETLLRAMPEEDLTNITMCCLNTACNTSQKAQKELIGQIESFARDIDQADLKTERVSTISSLPALPQSMGNLL